MSEYRWDLHLHTTHSCDGTMEPARLVEVAVKRGLAGMAVTDHGTIRGGLEARRVAPKTLAVVVGAELRLDRGEIIGLFLEREVVSRTLEGAAAEIRAQGGLVVLPHPFDEMRRSALRPAPEDSWHLDAVEVCNSRCIKKRYDDAALEYARRHNLAQVAGSDAHFANEVGRAVAVTDTMDLRGHIVSRTTRTVPGRSGIMNHARTKVLKIWRRSTSG